MPGTAMGAAVELLLAAGLGITAVAMMRAHVRGDRRRTSQFTALLLLLMAPAHLRAVYQRPHDPIAWLGLSLVVAGAGVAACAILSGRRAPR